ncbi:amidase [Kordiimonas sediminis]|uniref:Amidase n=1 Tax=Kordiimonas sediminis TaxID=1735581 RepID=A0A919AXE7_9PROT|nr:amidase [Kordiimonas sediminis]GHF31009.1 amidase [Kordiimonas sediminis]
MGLTGKRGIVLSALMLTVVACSEATPTTPTEGVTSDDTSSDSIVGYQPRGILSKSLPEIASAVQAGEVTSAELVQLYMDRIEAVDRSGPTLQSVLTLNPDAVAQAKALDAKMAAGEIVGPLHGVPVLLKDNIEAKDPMPTTAGALALKDNMTGRDSPLVKGLRDAGAIILGKTNLSQWANFRSVDSMSGWSALGGQVRNPHMLDRNPCGSSSGSGAAAAASLAAGTVGTETNGSIICPSNASGIVGFKPTVGVIPQDHIIPISATQDTAGPMTKTVMGAAMMMNAMATTTPDVDYTTRLSPEALKGVRVGVLRFAEGAYHPVIARFNEALADIEAAGGILVEITDRPSVPDGFGAKAYDLLKYEFKDGLNKYLASTDPAQVRVRTLADLIAFNLEHADVELALFDQSILLSSEEMADVDSADYKAAVDLVRETTQDNGLDLLLATYDVDVLVAPSGVVVPRVDPANGDVWPAWPGYGSHAARAGYPHATVPMGEVTGLSVGLSFIGGYMTDAAILSYAYAYEQRSQKRLEPRYLKDAEDLPRVAKAMKPYKPE